MPKSAQNATISSILKRTVRYFAIVGDISPFDRYFRCILHDGAENIDLLQILFFSLLRVEFLLDEMLLDAQKLIIKR